MPRYLKETCSTPKARSVDDYDRPKADEQSLLYFILQSLQVMRKQAIETNTINAQLFGSIFGYDEDEDGKGDDSVSSGLSDDLTAAILSLNEVLESNLRLSMRLALS